MSRNLYAVGGMLDGEVLNFAECYNPVDNLWSTVAPFPQPTSHCTSVSYQGKLYIIGGRTKNEQISKSVYR